MSHTRFRRVSRLRLGYHRRQVDAFLNHVEVSLSGVFPAPSAAEVRAVGFELVHGGYDVDAVDAYLDALEDRVVKARVVTGGRRGRVDPATETELLRKELEAPRTQRFGRTRPWRRGYHPGDVDDFVDRVLTSLDGAPDLAVDVVRQVSFRPRRGGYREDSVDAAMDHVVEHLQLVARPGPGRPVRPGAQRPAVQWPTGWTRPTGPVP